MAGGATAGILAGLMGGWDEQNAINRANAEYRHKKKRRKVTEAQNDKLFGLDVDSTKAGIVGKKQNNTIGAIKVKNSPTIAKQNLAIGKANVSTARSNATIAGQNATAHPGVLASNQKLTDARIDSVNLGVKGKRLGITQTQRAMSDAQLTRQHRKNQRTMSDAVAAYYTSGDVGPLVDAYNATVGKTTGVTVKDWKALPDGSIGVEFSNGHMRRFKDADQLAKVATIAAHPEVAAAQVAGVSAGGVGGVPGKTADERLRNLILHNHDWSVNNPDQVHQAYKIMHQVQMSPASMAEKAVAIAKQDVTFAYKSPEEQRAEVEQTLGLLQSAMQSAYKRKGAGQAGGATISSKRIYTKATGKGGQRKGGNLSRNDHGAAVATAVDTKGLYGPKGGTVIRYADGTVVPVNKQW